MTSPNPPPPRPTVAANAGGAAIPGAPPGWPWHLVAAAVLIAAVPLNMSGWVGSDVIPFGEYAGYITAIEQLHDNLARYGRVPSWLPDQLGGISHFTTDFKEFVALPFLIAFGSIAGYATVIALARVLAAYALYAIVATLFRAPLAGIVAGYAYGFGAIAAHRSTFSGHLDILLSYILVPLVFGAALKTLRARRRSWAVLLGALVAVQFAAHYLPGLVCALLVGLLWIGRPWCTAPADEALAAARDRWRAISPLVLSVAVFALLAASQIGWLVLDTPNHALHAPQAVERAREQYSMQSPFVLVNRTGWLAPWLEQHRPESLEVGPEGSLFAQRSYLGIAALAAIAFAATRLRRAPLHRKWYAFFGVAFFLQYWLAMGSNPLLWQLARSFHVSVATEQWIARLLVAAAALCVAAAGFLALRRRGGPSARVRAKRLLWTAAFLGAIPLSLFDVAQVALPPLRAVRAPAHFFDLAPFAFYAWVGVSLAAIAATLRRPVRRGALLVGVGLLVVIDFWPSRGAYQRGAPLEPLREFARTVAALEPGDPPARIGMVMRPTLSNRTYSSLLARASGAGSAWSWVAWQAGPHWHPYYHHVYQGLVRPRSDAPTSEWGNVLARVGRIKYFLDEFLGNQRLSLPPPWRRVAVNQRFALWEQPEVYPPAFGTRVYLLSVGAATAHELALGEVLARAGGVVLSAGDPGGAGFGALAAGASYLYADPSLRATLPPRISEKLVTPAELVERTRSVRRPLLEVGYERPAPEHIALRFDAGAKPAVVFVSESYHPWWRARVDGEPAAVLRATGAFMAVAVGPGEHRVDLEFRLPVALRGAELSSRLAWLALLAGLLVHAVKRVPARQRARRS